MADLSAFLQDAAHYPGGHATGVVFPRDEREVAGILKTADAVLPIGAQSSLTGGATPMGELIVSTSRMTGIGAAGDGTVTAQAGVTVAALQAFLAPRGAWFPPAPTFTGACVGGIVATNAAGAATFKYGSTRSWVEGLTVVLADGAILRLRRGESRASGGTLQIGSRRVPVPPYTLPAVPKVSAGYFAAPDMDAVDLFIGSEGTLGIITEVTLRTLDPAPAHALAMIPCRSERQAVRLAAGLRDASRRTWAAGDADGIDVSAIEHLDARSLAILREDGTLSAHNLPLPEDTSVVLFVSLELAPHMTATHAYDQIAGALQAGAPDSPLVRFCRLLDAAGVLDGTELALPGDTQRHAQLVAIREAVPSGVNRRVALAQARVDDRISKTAADMIVPFEHVLEMNDIYRRGFESRGLDYAIWGHLSDGNVHPNVIPRSYEDVVKGREAILEFGREAARLGGCPLAEHGVGRNRVKQELLRQLYGEEGIAAMRAVKRALDPDWKLAPGVIFGREDWLRT